MSDSNDVVSLTEVQAALTTSDNTNLAMTITAVSRLFDEQCGPIVKRSVTAVVDACGSTVDVGGPIDSVLSVTQLDGDTTTTIPASTTNGYALTARTSGTGAYTGIIERRGLTFSGRVTVVATQGRSTNTAAVDPKFKLAAIDTIRNLWRANEIGVGAVGEFDVPYPTFPSGFTIPNAARDLLGEDWNGQRNAAHVGVMWG